MSLVDVFFTPSLFITLAVCLILISLLGLYFIQKINQQNHKINTMVDLVATLGEQMNVLRSAYLPNNISAGGAALDTSNTPISQNLEQAQMGVADTHTVSMIHVSDNEDNDDSEIEYDEEDEEESDDEEEESDEEEDSDDEEEDNDEEVSDQEVEDVEELELPDLSTDDIDETLIVKKANIESVEVEEIPDLEPDEVIQEDEEEEVPETVVKSLDVVLDYKKASLTKLRDIVQSKGLVTDASKMKKSDILKVLEGQ